MEENTRLNPRKKPAQERSKFTVDIILKAAVQVFEDRGYYKTTTKLIADRAGVSVGTLYQYFPNKESVLCSLMERHIQETSALIINIFEEVELTSELNVSMISSFFETMLRLHREEPAYHRIIFEEVPNAQQLLWEWAGKAEERITRSLEGLFAESKSIHVKNTKMAARLCSQIVNMLTHRYVLLNTNQGADREFIEEMVDILASYLFKE